jgi:filamentous hemagglutinin
VSQISRDTASAENALKDKFDAEKAEDSTAVQREMAVLGQQVIQQTFDYLKLQAKQQERDKLKNDKTFNEMTAQEQEKYLSDRDKEVEKQYGIG